MASKILKGLAVAAGVGLAVGLGSGKRRREENSMHTHFPDDGLILERLDRIEFRLSAVETQPSSVTALEPRIQQQARDIEMLQLQVAENRQKMAGEVATIEKRFGDLTKGIPAVLESIIVPRIDDLRVHLRSELQQSVNATLTRFERAIDDKISDRMSILEKALLDQSSIVTALSQRAVESDMNLQRLISAVERLCGRGNLTPPPPQEKIPTPTFQSAFRPRIVKEDDEDREPRHRIPLTRL